MYSDDLSRVLQPISATNNSAMKVGGVVMHLWLRWKCRTRTVFCTSGKLSGELKARSTKYGFFEEIKILEHE
jgi:hypothetical protein